jgi:hypothetical protein
VTTGSYTAEWTLNKLVEKKNNIQSKVWGSKFFAEWVRGAFVQMNEAQYVAMAVDQRREFWNNRITFTMVGELFKTLHPVDLRTAWEDTTNGWHNYILVCIRVAAHAFTKNIVYGDQSIPELERKKDVYATIRQYPNMHLADRAGLRTIPCLAIRFFSQADLAQLSSLPG